MNRLFLLLVAVFSNIAFAGNLNCQGTVSHAYVSSSGLLIIQASYRNNYTKLCSVKDNTDGVDVVTCSLWASIIQSSIVNDKEVIVRYPDIESCQTLPTYSATKVPEYVMLVR